MPAEQCDECRFDGNAWTDASAIDTAHQLHNQWADAIAGLTVDELQRRPIDGMWSIAEYTDHVRETAFGMRFVLDTVLNAPGTDLGEPPEPRFEPDARSIDVPRALSRFQSEITQLCDRLRAVPHDQWDATCTIGGEDIDIHWIARHIVHDVTHHLGDVARLRLALGRHKVRELERQRLPMTNIEPPNPAYSRSPAVT
jgi:hypothetical protein